MRSNTRELEAFRLMGKPEWGFNGAYAFLFSKKGCPDSYLRVVVSDGSEWHKTGMRMPAFEHASISTPHRCPTWDEMCFIKDKFWASHECVIQYHPPRDQYVNQHPFCLHLWKPCGIEIPIPPKESIA